MGRRGPAPKPTALRVLHGEKRYRINTAEPLPRNAPPERPDWLTAYAVEEWDRIFPDLEAMGVAKAVDAAGLAAYCEAVSELRRCTELLAKSRPLIRRAKDGELVPNPLFRLRQRAADSVRVWAREFGFTPASRQPLKVELSGADLLSPSRILS